jgi:hypothetical protein
MQLTVAGRPAARTMGISTPTERSRNFSAELGQ